MLSRFLGFLSLLAILWCTLFAVPTFAQPSDTSSVPVKYWIFFTDKQAAPGKGPTEPAAGYVSTPAQQRRHNRGAASRPQDDRPVSSTYTNRLKTHQITPVVKSRWFNAISAYLDKKQLAFVKTLSFVRSVRPVGQRVSIPPPAAASGKTAVNRSAAAAKTAINYGPSRFQLSFMNAISPLEQGFNGQGVVIGFLDTQFDFDHPALRHIKNEGRLIAKKDFTGPLVDSTGIANDNYHGLSVISTTMGYAPGQLIGPAHKAQVLAATTEYVPRERNQEEDFLVAGLEWLERKGADVVNISLGYTTFDSTQTDYTYQDMNGDRAISTRAADRAVSKGLTVVAAAGNEGCRSPDNCWFYIGAPADGDSVITVGAARPDSTKAFFSSFGPTYDGRIKPDVSTLGRSLKDDSGTQGVYVATPSEQTPFTYSNGTSFSSPLVTGVVAQLLQANPTLTPIEVRQVLRETASQAARPDTLLGWGIVNAGAALNQVRPITFPDQPELTAPYPNPFVDAAKLIVELPADQPERAQLVLYDRLGRKIAVPYRGTLSPGPNAVSIDGTNLSSGVYLYRLVAETFSRSGTLVKME